MSQPPKPTQALAAPADTPDDLANIPDMSHELVIVEKGQSTDLDNIPFAPESAVVEVRDQHSIVVDGNVITLEKLIRMENLQKRMDLFTLFLDKIPLDQLIGFLFPGAGDIGTGALTYYNILEATKLGCPPEITKKMTVNLGIDIAAGFFPGIDLLLDWAWKANKKNGELFRKHLNKARAEYQAIDPEGFADAQKRGLVALERVKIRNVLSGIKKLLQGK